MMLWHFNKFVKIVIITYLDIFFNDDLNKLNHMILIIFFYHYRDMNFYMIMNLKKVMR